MVDFVATNKELLKILDWWMINNRRLHLSKL